MKHNMKLNENAFKNISNKIKKIELRLNDEKRQTINLNDTIEFTNLSDINDKILVKVIGLLHFNSFEELFKVIDYNICGPAPTVQDKINNIRKYYSKEDEKKYGILAIRIEII